MGKCYFENEKIVALKMKKLLLWKRKNAVLEAGKMLLLEMEKLLAIQDTLCYHMKWFDLVMCQICNK